MKNKKGGKMESINFLVSFCCGMVFTLIIYEILR